ncbi:MazG-like family protein [Peribacillus sp. NPDC058075]|uniref:MazG-like family protein n=1 Tax=unclassified Peribacillus TaxID=2675266 RepID=UPI0036DDDBDE
MNVTEFQQWVKDYYEAQGWSELDIFIRIGFLAEETGEVARAIRSLEIGRNRPDEVIGSYEENFRSFLFMGIKHFFQGDIVFVRNNNQVS